MAARGSSRRTWAWQLKQATRAGSAIDEFVHAPFRGEAGVARSPCCRREIVTKARAVVQIYQAIGNFAASSMRAAARRSQYGAGRACVRLRSPCAVQLPRSSPTGLTTREPPARARHLEPCRLRRDESRIATAWLAAQVGGPTSYVLPGPELGERLPALSAAEMIPGAPTLGTSPP
jgi:hypothetical protein